MDTCNSLQDVLRDRAKADSGAVKCYSLGNTEVPLRVSYRDLYTQAQHNSDIIRRLPGSQDHHPIVLSLDTHVDTIIWFWFVLLADGVPVVLGPSSDVSHNQDHVTGLAALLEHPICITTSDLKGAFDADHGICVYVVEHVQSLEMPPEKPDSRFQHQGGSATAVLMLTSGSTGTSKAVALSHRQILAAVTGKAAVRPLTGGLPFLNWIGLDHVASLVEIHIQALWLGVDQIHVHAADIVSSPTTFLSLLHQHKVTRSFAPNFFLAKLVVAVQDEADDDRWDLSNLSLLASGGEDNDVDTCLKACSLLRRYKAPRGVITTGFGMTETCAGAIFNLNCPDYDIRRGRSVASLGKCIDGIEMRVTVPGHDMQLAAPDEPGHLEIRGDVVFDDYYRNPRATAEAFTPDGWFRTGDEATIDDEGCLSLVGRVKDIVNINGAKFAVSNIQTALDQALSGRTARVVTFASRAAHTEQVTVAYIPRNRNMAPNEALAIQTCQLQVGASLLIFSIREESVPLLPKSALGKILRAKMATLYKSGTFSTDVDLHFSRVKQLREQRNGADDKQTSNAEAILIRLLAELQRVDSGTIGPNTSIFGARIHFY
jgi:acyl-CoA synthetase (AMP-forming)/AMP-acid ligase II